MSAPLSAPANASVPEPAPDSLADAGFVAALRQQMVKFARLHLGDSHLAEDAVQEALVGAWTGGKRFAGRSAFKTWVFAILKHKVADLLRHKQRMVDAGSLLKEGEGQSLDDFFDDKGHWLQDAKPDLVVVDPPRAGLHPRALGSLLAARPHQIGYLSCNAASLVRDLQLLCSSFPRYRIKALRAFDMFPQTNHFETAAVLERT